MDKDPSGKKIYGLIGYPVKHSLSPAMHNAAFQALNIDAEYRLFEVPPQRLEEFLLNTDKIFEDTDGNSVRAGDILGFNITIPHKVPALLKSTTIVTSHEVILVGSVNTVKRDKNTGKLYYYNTDTTGFMKSLQEDLKFDTRNKNVFIFGCGGAGRAIIAGLTCKGTNVKKIYIYDVNKDAMDSTKRHFDNFSDYMEGELEFITEAQILEKIE